MSKDPISPPDPTLFAEVSLVNRSHMRESSKPKTTPDISGRKCLELSGNSGPLGCVEKMLLDSCDWAWTKYSLTWKAKATPQGRLIFQLARQAHPISDNDYGLLHTPTAKANQTSPSMVERGHGNWVSNLWPTPNTRDTRRGCNQKQLATEVDKYPYSPLWPTPTAMTGGESVAPSHLTGKHGWNIGVAVNAVSPKTIGHLNPKWVAWLMGYPTEYLSCVPWETRSSRKSQKK
jgi:hypothetical protein